MELLAYRMCFSSANRHIQQLQGAKTNTRWCQRCTNQKTFLLHQDTHAAGILLYRSNYTKTVANNRPYTELLNRFTIIMERLTHYEDRCINYSLIDGQK